MPGVLTTILIVLLLALIAMMIASMWTIFAKAGQPGYRAIILPFIFVPILAFGDAKYIYSEEQNDEQETEALIVVLL